MIDYNCWFLSDMYNVFEVRFINLYMVNFNILLMRFRFRSSLIGLMKCMSDVILYLFFFSVRYYCGKFLFL